MLHVASDNVLLFKQFFAATLLPSLLAGEIRLVANFEPEQSDDEVRVKILLSAPPLCVHVLCSFFPSFCASILKAAFSGTHTFYGLKDRHQCSYIHLICRSSLVSTQKIHIECSNIPAL